jgi:hypothetical protein
MNGMNWGKNENDFGMAKNGRKIGQKWKKSWAKKGKKNVEGNAQICEMPRGHKNVI